MIGFIYGVQSLTYDSRWVVVKWFKNKSTACEYLSSLRVLNRLETYRIYETTIVLD